MSVSNSARHDRRFCAILTFLYFCLACREATVDPVFMTGQDDDSFRIKPGRSRSKGTRANTRDLPFLQQAKIAARKAGGGSRF